MSQELYQARQYEIKTENKIKDTKRPKFHLSARVGWMNDPNGFCYYNGEYHLFYQYHPYNSHWGPMHWGHAVSKDLLHWTHLPVAIAPDTDYDKNGCFSGSAISLEDGKHLLLYTGVTREEQPDGSCRDIQTQCVAVGDGMDYEKYEKNPVLAKDDLPEGGSKFDFRDPKIWRDLDGTFWCVVANCTEDKDGQILLYRSNDGVKWTFETILIKNHKRFGKMWECPDFFELDNSHVLLVSPQDMLAQGMEYINGNGTVCIIGDYDTQTKKFVETKNHAIDYGIDFYAPQTVLALDGRRIMIGWMQNWDSTSVRMEKDTWFGQMSLPRELSVKNGRLIQKPIREIEGLRNNKVEYKNVIIKDEITLEGISGRTVDMEITIRPESKESTYKQFAIHFAQDETYYTSIIFDYEDSLLTIDRKYSGIRRATIHERKTTVNHCNGELKLRVILDNFSAEVFVNDGEKVLTTTIYTDATANNISFSSKGCVEMDIEKYDLMVGETSETV